MKRAEYDFISDHDAFDAEYYLTRYPDVRGAGFDPLFHYVSSGAAEGRDPSAGFSTLFYVATGPALEGRNPLAHHLSDIEGTAHRVAPSPITPQPWNLSGPSWRESFERRLSYRMAKLRTADLSPPWDDAAPTFSILTTVYDTKPEFLWEVAETVREQAFADFEWVLLDNGSNETATIEACEQIARSDDRIKFHRVEQNLHIIGGNRFVLERAVGRYVVPIDSDDLLYPDSLALIADVLRANRDEPPVAIFSDEQKVDASGRPVSLIWRWPFCLAHALSTAPAAHLLVFSREKGLEANVYTDDYARGSHDWDSALRLTEGGGVRVAHVPEVLYGWRVHEGSTALDNRAKGYVIESQIDVMAHSLRRRGLGDKFRVEPIFPETPGWYAVKRHGALMPRVQIDLVVPWSAATCGSLRENFEAVVGTSDAVVRVICPNALLAKVQDILRAVDLGQPYEIRGVNSRSELDDALNDVIEDAYAKVIVSSKARLTREDAVSDAVAVLEVDSDAGIVFGPLLRADESVFYAGYYSGLDGFLGAPFAQWTQAAVPGHIWRLRRPVTAGPLLCFAVRASVLKACAPISLDDDDGLAGASLCLEAAEKGVLSVITPGLAAVYDGRLSRHVGGGDSARIRLGRRYARIVHEPVLSPHIALPGRAYETMRRTTDIANEADSAYAKVTPAIPLNLALDPELEQRSAINVLLPVVRLTSMSGGPNTALNLAYRLAQRGFAVRVMSTDLPPDEDHGPLYEHFRRIGGGEETLAAPRLTIVDASNREVSTKIGANDVFLATAWWTAHMAHAASPLLAGRPFVYLIQDFEPILYAASSRYALAAQPYGFPHLPVINSLLLRDYLFENRVGQFADEAHARRAIAFDPAVDPKHFNTMGAGDAEVAPRRRRRLLFYARPVTGVRNLFELGVAALRKALASRVLSADRWEFVGMGEQFDPVDLGAGARLVPAPWLGFEDYASQMRSSDLLLSLMLSPHPSYPPLEMAQCGGVAVTSVYANKTAERMAAISPNIIAVEPTVTALADALEEAVIRLDDREQRQAGAKIAYPGTWDESFSSVIPDLANRLVELGVQADAASRPPAGEPVRLALPFAPDAAGYGAFLEEGARRRAANNVTALEPGLLSLVSTVWNTAPAFLDVLARSVRNQEGGLAFEWLILDNGSVRADTRAFLEKLALEPNIRVERVEQNLGIVRGMRWCLENASGRYILPLDSDDYLYPDCMRTMTWHLQRLGYPGVVYTDEDKLSGEELSGPFLKPDFDPVLFSTQCFIAHLCAIDRKIALDLGAYSDGAAEGSHDWDTFTRFVNAGHIPQHVPEVLYSWRIHAQSTAGNIDSKPFVYASQRSVISRWLSGKPKGSLFDIEQNPWFAGTPDWWLKRKRTDGRPITTVVVGGTLSDDAIKAASDLDHEIVRLDGDAALEALAGIARDCAARSRLVHVLSGDATPSTEEWGWEAIGTMDLYDDAVLVGGLIHGNDRVLAGGGQFGFGSGFGYPDRGRPLANPGYAAETWKHRSAGFVSAMHCVFEPEFLAAAIDYAAPRGGSIFNLGAWAGGAARRLGKRVVYSPIFKAEARIDWEDQITARERGVATALFADVIPERRLISPHRLRQQTSPNVPAIETPGLGALLDLEINAGRTGERAAGGDIGFSVLTTVYSGTDARLFRLTAASVLGQSHAALEWVILAHGPVSEELDGAIAELVRDPRVRSFKLAENRGIVGGIRYALEHATLDYVVPMDADDLLTVDALALIAEHIASQPSAPAIVYSDEDIIVGDTIVAPCKRTAWDPVIDLENSWIWHAVAYKRSLALELDVYGDVGAEYCHDWDTIDRFSAAGHVPSHIGKVLYHWRHHERSTSGSGAENEGSSRSVEHVLRRKLARAGKETSFDVETYPIWRGAKEWWLTQRSWSPLETLTVRVVYKNIRARFGDELVISALAPVSELAEAVRASSAEHVLFTVDGLQPIASDSLREADKLFQMLPDIAMVSGRTLHDGRVASAGLAAAPATGALQALYVGLSEEDAGPMARALKPHAIDVPNMEAAVASRAFVVDALSSAPAYACVADLDALFAVVAAGKGLRIAFSPTFAAVAGANKPPRMVDVGAKSIVMNGLQMTVAADRRKPIRVPKGAAG